MLQGDLVIPQIDAAAPVFVSFHDPLALVVVDEQKPFPGFMVVPDSSPHCLQILRRLGLDIRQISVCRGKNFLKVVDEEMQLFQLAVRSVKQTRFPDAGLEIVTLNGIIVIIPGGFGLLQS